jgi:hypothetical protein
MAVFAGGATWVMMVWSELHSPDSARVDKLEKQVEKLKEDVNGLYGWNFEDLRGIE